MSTIEHGNTTCSDCGIQLDEKSNISLNLRSPCPKCGSLKRNHSILIRESLTIQSSLGAKGKREGKGRPFIEMFSGAAWMVGLQKWIQKYRLIDRDNDQYKEIIKDPDNDNLIHSDESKLSEHKGHGSAKEKIK